MSNKDLVRHEGKADENACFLHNVCATRFFVDKIGTLVSNKFYIVKLRINKLFAISLQPFYLYVFSSIVNYSIYSSSALLLHASRTATLWKDFCRIHKYKLH